MTKKFIDRVLMERTVDTAKYRYIAKNSYNHAYQWQEIRRIERSKLDTTEALDDWAWDRVWSSMYLIPTDAEGEDRLYGGIADVCCVSPAAVMWSIRQSWPEDIDEAEDDLFDHLRIASDDEIAEYGVWN